MEVVGALSQRIETASEKHTQLGPAVQRDGSQFENSRRVAELAAHVHIERLVVLNADAHERTARGSGVDILSGHIDCGCEIRRAGRDVVAPVEKIESAARDVQLVNREVIHLEPALRPAVPAREVVHELRAGRINLEEKMWLDDVDAIDGDLPAPE